MRNDVEKRWHGAGAPRFLDFLSSKTKGHISSLSVDQLLKTKVAIRAIPSVQRHRHEKEYVAKEFCSRNFFGDRPPRKRRKEVRYPDPDAGQKDLILQTSPPQAARKATCTKCPHPGGKCPFEQYTVSRPKPPMPPRRTSSLPKSARAMEVITRPSAPLSDFELGPQDGQFFQRLVAGSSNVFGCLYNSRLWPLVLQTCHSEPCIRHITLATSMAQQAHRGQNSTALLRAASSHYVKAANFMNELLSRMRVGADTQSWEVVLLASFLFTTFDVLSGIEGRAYWWMQSSLLMLKTAIGVLGRNGSAALSGNLKELALVFRRLDVKSVPKLKGSARNSIEPQRVEERSCPTEIVRRRRLLRRLGEPSAFGRSERRKARMGKSGVDS